MRGGKREGVGRPPGPHRARSKAFWLREDILRQLDSYAEREGERASQVVQKAIVSYILRGTK